MNESKPEYQEKRLYRINGLGKSEDNDISLLTSHISLWDLSRMEVRGQKSEVRCRQKTGLNFG